MLKSMSYKVEIPDCPEAVLFVNGLIARDRFGFFWLWRNLKAMQQATGEAPGCVQVKAGICGPNEIVMASYWQSEDRLMDFFRNKFHREMMQAVMQHPDSFCLYNETYRPTKSGKYSHEPQGMAMIYGV